MEGVSSNNIWPRMRENDCVAIGWAKLGDLSRFNSDQESTTQIARLLVRHYKFSPSIAKAKARQLQRFVFTMAEGEIVLAARGERIVGLGRVAGPYRFDPILHDGAPHQRAVDWKPGEEFDLPVQEGVGETVYQYRLKKSSDNLVAVETILQKEGTAGVRDVRRVRHVARLNGTPGGFSQSLRGRGRSSCMGPQGPARLSGLGKRGRIWPRCRPLGIDLKAWMSSAERESRAEGGSLPCLECAHSIRHTVMRTSSKGTVQRRGVMGH